MTQVLARFLSPALTLVGGLLLTTLASIQVKTSIEEKAVAEFALVSDRITLKIEDRLAAYASILQGGKALFAATGEVSRAQWKDYVETLHTEGFVPGVQGIGFTEFIRPDRLAAHTARVRSEGFPDYEVRPSGERAAYSAIVYLEPFDARNQRAFGYDMYSEPVRQAAMARARDTGSPALSGKVVLVQETDEDVQSGTLMYIPVYRNGASTETIEERRDALLGWVYSPYRMNDLMAGMLGGWSVDEQKRPGLRIYDGESIAAGQLLFDSGVRRTLDPSPLFHQQRQIGFNGTHWLLVFDHSQAAAEIDYFPAWLTLAGGICISALLCGMLFLLQSRSRALREVEALAGELKDREALLRESEFRWKFAIEGSGDGLFDWNVAEHRIFYSPTWKALLGYGEGEIGDSEEEWLGRAHPDDLATVQAKVQACVDGKIDSYRVDLRMRCKDGGYKWLLGRGVVVSKSGDGRAERILGTIADIDERKSLEEFNAFRTRILEMLAGDAEVDEILLAIIAGIERQCPHMLCSILLMDEEGRQLGRVFAPNLPADWNRLLGAGIPVAVGVGACGTAASTGERVVTSDIASDPHWHSFRATAIGNGLRSCWSQPIVDASGAVLGTFAIYQREVHTPTAADITLIEQSARLASIALEQNAAETKLRESEERYRQLIESSTEGICVAEGGYLRYCNPAFLELLGYSREALFARPYIEFVVEAERPAFRDFYGKQISGDVSQLRFEIPLATAHRGPRWFDIGSVRFDWQGKPASLNFLTDITERKQSEEQIRQYAFYDALTRLPNRRLLKDRLDTALAACRRSREHGALMLLDLDNFKPLNDQHGHAVGDLLLIEVARRLSLCVREVDTVARLGGDEFVVLLTGLGEDRAAASLNAQRVAEKIRAALAQTYRLTADAEAEVVEHHCSSSIGLTLFDGADGEQKEIVRRADEAMYRAKEGGRNRISVANSGD